MADENDLELVEGDGKEPADILLVEDNRGDAVLITKRITRKFPGREVMHVKNFRGAADALAEYEFNIIFLDLNLPDDFGIETVRDLRQIAKDVYLVAITGLAGELTIREAKKAGADEVFVKAYLDDDALDKIMRSSTQPR